MIDFYEERDFNEEVWVYEDGELESETLRDVCSRNGDADGKYRAEGCELFKYRANHQLPRSAIATFDSEAEAEHAYWLMLLYHTTADDNMPMIFWDASNAAAFCSEEIGCWDGVRIEELRYWLHALDRVCEAGSLDRQGYVDMSDLGGVTLPDDVVTSFPVWAMDEKGDMLVGDGADGIENVEQYRAR